MKIFEKNLIWGGVWFLVLGNGGGIVVVAEKWGGGIGVVAEKWGGRHFVAKDRRFGIHPPLRMFLSASLNIETTIFWREWGPMNKLTNQPTKE